MRNACRFVLTAYLVVQIVIGDRFWIPGKSFVAAAYAAEGEHPTPQVPGAAPAEHAKREAAVGFDYGVDTNSGSFGATIPIETPPGRLGVQPALALSYSSTSNAPGIAGVGWSLRLPVLRADPITTARYLLDGERLIETAANTYATERETYSKIRRMCGAAYCSFTVDERNGMRMRFGTNADSRNPGRWGLDRVEDAHGNYMTINYLTDADLGIYGTGGALYPKEIRYTGSATRAPWYRVQFGYEVRPAADTYYFDSVLMRLRLRTIQVRGGDNSTIRTYTLSYASSATGRSLLTGVSVTGLSNVTGPRPFAMTYTMSPSGFAPLVATTAAPHDSRAVGGDFNADGRFDLMTFRRTNDAGVLVDQWHVQLGGAAGLEPSAIWLSAHAYNFPTSCSGAADRVFAGDWDADGDTDLFHFAKGCGSAPRWYIIEARGNTFVVRDWVPAATTADVLYDVTSASVVFGDVTGDGRADAVLYRPAQTTHVVQSLPASPWFSTSTTTAASTSPLVAAGEIDGGGMTDLVFQAGTSVVSSCARGTSFTACGGLTAPSSSLPRTGDFDGDGRTDLLFSGMLATSLGFDFAEQSVTTPTGAVGDVDGDGRDDVVQTIDNGNFTWTLRTHLRRGGGFVAGSSNGFPDITSTAVPVCSYNTELLLGDLTGDGRADPILRVRSALGTSCSNYQFATTAVSAPAIDRLSKLETPTGLSLEPTYRRVTSAGLPVSLLVIDRLTLRDFTRGGKFLFAPVIETHRYTFSNNRWDAARRQLMGFSAATDDILERDLTEVTTYHQDIARRGKAASRSSSRTSTGALLAGDTYTYHDDATAPYASELAWHVRMYFDPTGNISARTLQGYTYDAAGNVTGHSDHGLCGRTDDDRHVATIYRSATDFNVHRPVQITTYSGALIPPTTIANVTGCGGSSFAVLESSLHEYDQSTTTVTRGDLTRASRLSIAPNGAQTWQRTRDFSYRADGLLASTTDARGFASTVVAYDPVLDQYPARVRNAAGHEEVREYQPWYGKVSKVTDPNGSVVELDYDGFGRTKWVRTPLSSGLFLPTVTFAYGDTVPNWKATITPFHNTAGTTQGAAAVTFFDALGRSIANVRDGDSLTERVISGRMTYWTASKLPLEITPPAEVAAASCGSLLSCLASNALYNPAQVDWAALTASATGTPARFTHDPLGRTTRRDNADGSFVAYEHTVDQLGFGLFEVDEVGDQKRLHRDARGDLARVERWSTANAQPEVTTYTRDGRRKLTSITTPLGVTTTLHHGSLGRLDRVVSPELGTITFAYDLDGHETSRTDARGVTISTTVDALGRPTMRTSTTGEQVMYAYDRDPMCTFWCTSPPPAADNTMGRPWAVLDETGFTSFAYDRDGHVTRETRNVAGSTYVTSYENWATGQVVRKTFPDGEAHRFALAPDGQPAALFIGAATLPTVSLTRDGQGRPSTVRYASGARMAYHVDPLTQRIDAIDTFDPAGTRIQHVGYGFRPDGTIESVDRDDTLGTDEELYLDHDGAKRLTDVFVPQTSSPAEHYEYDADGRMRVRQDRDAAAVTLEYGDAQHPHAVTRVGDRSLAYDAAGNRVADGATAITYDGESRMRSHGVTSYSYDADGRRVIENLAGGTRRVTVGGYVVEPDGSSTKLLQLGELRLGERSSVTGDRFFHTDGVGSVIGETNAAGALDTSRRFSAFGTTIDEVTGSSASRRGFGGYTLDGTGLYHANARYYDPTTASFTTPDSWLYGFDNPDTLNAFAYAANSPYQYSDPSGHVIVAALVGAAVMFAVGTAIDFATTDDHWAYIIIRNVAIAGASFGMTWAMTGMFYATLATFNIGWTEAGALWIAHIAGRTMGSAAAHGMFLALDGAKPDPGNGPPLTNNPYTTGFWFGVLVGGSLLTVPPIASAIWNGAMTAIETAALRQIPHRDSDYYRDPNRLDRPSLSFAAPSCGLRDSARTMPGACDRLSP